MDASIYFGLGIIVGIAVSVLTGSIFYMGFLEGKKFSGPKAENQTKGAR